MNASYKFILILSMLIGLSSCTALNTMYEGAVNLEQGYGVTPEQIIESTEPKVSYEVTKEISTAALIACVQAAHTNFTKDNKFVSHPKMKVGIYNEDMVMFTMNYNFDAGVFGKADKLTHLYVISKENIAVYVTDFDTFWHPRLRDEVFNDASLCATGKPDSLRQKFTPLIYNARKRERILGPWSGDKIKLTEDDIKQRGFIGSHVPAYTQTYTQTSGKDRLYTLAKMC